MNQRHLNASIFLQLKIVFQMVFRELLKRKLGTLLTVIVIAVSLTIPVTTYLLWKNVEYTIDNFYPESELAVYLNKNLSEQDTERVVESLRAQQGVDTLNYISRQKSLEDFRQWSGFNEELSLLDDNPLPAVVMIKPTEEFKSSDKVMELRTELMKAKGVQEVRLDDGWIEKLGAISYLVAKIAVICCVLMSLAVFLVLGNSVRSDVYSSRSSIEVMKLLGATNHFILRPFLCTGIIYGVLGSMLATIFSFLLIAYFSTAVSYVADIFAIKIALNGLALSEILFMIIICAAIGYAAAWISANKHINDFEKKN